MMAEALAVVSPTLREVAGWLGVSYGTIRAYSAGTRQPTGETLARCAAALRRHARHLERLAARMERQGGTR